MKLTQLLAATVLTSASLGFSANSFAAADLTAVPAGDYASDPTHSYITFEYSHLGLSNPILSFDEFVINLNLDPAKPDSSSVSVDIDSKSVVTGSAIWYDHITGGKWFDVGNNPSISFKSTSVTGSGSAFQVTGDLTIKGMTKAVTLDVTINGAMNHPMNKKPVVGVTATGSVLRSDWGLGANVPFVSDEVKLRIEAELFKG